MVKKRIFGILLFPILLLSSCNKQQPLRSDIAKFIASFSLEDSISIYLEAGYESTRIISLNSEYTKEVDKVDFNVKDPENISYQHDLVVYDENDNIVSEKHNSITKVGDEYIHTLDGNSEVYTLEQCSSLITTFFYVGEPMEGFHDYGMYYGDYVQSSARYIQNYVKIEDEQYIYELHQINAKQGADLYQKYMVDKYGMLLYNHVKNINTKTNESVEQTITVYNVI